MWRTLQKQDRGAKQREQSTAIQGAKISHDGIQGAKIHFKGNPSRRYPTKRPPTHPLPPADQAKRPASRPPAKRTKFSGPGEPSQAPQAEPPTEDSQIPVGIPLETVIRRPMIAGPPIEGNLDCRDRSFHSKTYFDIEALRQQPELREQPELRDSFRLLQRVVLDFIAYGYSGVRNPTLIHFTIDGRLGAIGARHIAEALQYTL
ncbi:hypothetical protein AAG906_017457 [Vitis piasezkii]